MHDLDSCPPTLDQLRAEASRLLTDLEHSRDDVLQRAQVDGRSDPIVEVTGLSSLDRAVRSVERMIRDFDAMIATDDVMVGTR